MDGMDAVADIVVAATAVMRLETSSADPFLLLDTFFCIGLEVDAQLSTSGGDSSCVSCRGVLHVQCKQRFSQPPQETQVRSKQLTCVKHKNEALRHTLYSLGNREVILPLQQCQSTKKRGEPRCSRRLRGAARRSNSGGCAADRGGGPGGASLPPPPPPRAAPPAPRAPAAAPSLPPPAHRAAPRPCAPLRSISHLEQRSLFNINCQSCVKYQGRICARIVSRAARVAWARGSSDHLSALCLFSRFKPLSSC